MNKLRLSLEELSIESFDTTGPDRKPKGTVFGEQQNPCTCPTACTCPGCPTCYNTCDYTCDDATCPACPTCGASCNSCDGTCAGTTCITRCVGTCICN